MVEVRVTWARKLTTGEHSSMLDVTVHSSTSSADPDALALLAYSLGDLGHVTQRQTERLLTNRQTADHASAFGLFASRLSKSSGVTEAVSRDFAHADGRTSLAFLGIAQTIRSRPIAKKGKNFASHSSGVVVSKRTARAAVVGRKKTVTRAARVVRVVRKPAVKSAHRTSVKRGSPPNLRTIQNSRIISALQVQALLRVAASQIGVREQRTNRTKYGRWYGMNGQAWCAMFVSWVGAHAGVSLPRINSFRGFSGVVSARNFARKNNLLTKTPRAGSVFLIIGRNGKGHTGLVESVNWARRTITTIEGNTNASGSRNGDGVYRRTRKISSINGGFMLIPRKRS
jgi:CHAP domain